MGKRGRPAKDKFADLPQDFKENTEGMSEPELRERIAQVALDEAALQKAKGDDQDLKDKKEQAKLAGQIYSDGSKANKLKILWLRQLLEDKGKDVGEFSHS